MIKIGDKVVCIQEEIDEDFGFSGIVLKGNKHIKLNKEYIITDIDRKHIPKYNDLFWTRKQYKQVEEYWTLLYLKGVSEPTFFGDTFKIKNKDGKR